MGKICFAYFRRVFRKHKRILEKLTKTINIMNNILTINTKPTSRNDARLMSLRRNLGLEGYAVYAMLEEALAEGGGCIEADYALLAFDFRTEEEMVRSVAEDYALFRVDGGRLMLLADAADAELRRKRSEAGRKGMCSRWNKRRDITNDNKTITTGGEKKEKENLPPTPPIKEKDKEKTEEEKKEISALENKQAFPSDGRNVPSDDDKDSANHADSKSSVADADSKSSDADRFCLRFRNYWNDCIRRADSRLKPISILNASRRRQLERLRRDYDSTQISWLVWRACNSPYLNARDGRLRRPADLDWMLASDSRIVKIIEGNL